jgi:GT2 family glycosyltransferase
MRTTVVVITMDRRDELLRTLGHLTALPERPPLIVVDNASGDGTAEAVAARYPEVRLIRSDRNLGAVARNLAVAEVRTPYVAFCDDDTWWEPGAMDRAADLLDAHPLLASVTGLIVVEPGLGEDPITPELRDSPVPRPGWMPGPALLSILAGASMLRVSAFRQVGGFSPRLWLGGEEELLSLDLAARGWWLLWAEDVIVHHEASTARDSRLRRRLGIRNTLWTAWLRRPLRDALRRTVAVLVAVPRDRATVAAVAAALAGLPWVLRERRVVPRAVAQGLRLLEEPQRTSPARRYVD